MTLSTTARARLHEVLVLARSRGRVGPGDPDEHIAHALGFLAVVELAEGARLVDLGSGGGLPGLVLGAARPDLDLVLVDAANRSVVFLREAIGVLGLDAEVVHARAEDVGRDPAHRGRADCVTARGFGPPAATAECAAALLAVGGRLVVSEPPGGRRWPDDGLARLGLAPLRTEVAGGRTYGVTEALRPCPEAYPRVSGEPARDPLFEVASG